MARAPPLHTLEVLRPKMAATQEVQAHTRLTELLQTTDALDEVVIQAVRGSIGMLSELASTHGQPLRLGLDDGKDQLHVFIGHPNGFALWASLGRAGICVSTNGTAHGSSFERVSASELTDDFVRTIPGHSFDGPASNEAESAAPEGPG